MKILATICILFSLLLSIDPVDKEDTKEMYVIGRFTVIKDTQGYQASTKDTISPYYSTMAKSIKSIK
jgi:hypothetical protein